MVSCAVCGSGSVAKDLMAPAIGAPAPEPALLAPASPAEQALAELRRRIEATSEDVGRDFAAEARAIHEGLAPERSIIGEATVAEARALHRGRHPGRPPALVLRQVELNSYRPACHRRPGPGTVWSPRRRFRRRAASHDPSPPGNERPRRSRSLRLPACSFSSTRNLEGQCRGCGGGERPAGAGEHARAH